MADVRAKDVTIAVYSRAECHRPGCPWHGPFRAAEGRTTAYRVASEDREQHLDDHRDGLLTAQPEPEDVAEVERARALVAEMQERAGAAQALMGRWATRSRTLAAGADMLHPTEAEEHDETRAETLRECIQEMEAALGTGQVG